MKIAFLITPFGISGGLNVIFQWATLLSEAGFEIYVSVPDRKDLENRPHFVRQGDAKFKIVCNDDLESLSLDLALGTWWESWQHLSRVKAQRRAVFVQSLEAAFYEPGDTRIQSCLDLLRSELPTICISNWIADYLTQFLGREESSIQVVVNAYDKDMFVPTQAKIAKSGKIRFLVEGPHFLPYKGIPETLKILNDLEAEYIWVGSFIDKNLIGPSCVGVFEAVPYHEMPSIYASADVLLKLSSIEGMFGPPLEMFATGGTALVWDVFGYDEYLAHGLNAVVVPMHDFRSVREYVQRLTTDRELVSRLQMQALKTARSWPSWRDIQQEMVQAIECVLRNPASAEDLPF